MATQRLDSDGNPRKRVKSSALTEKRRTKITLPVN